MQENGGFLKQFMATLSLIIGLLSLVLSFFPLGFMVLIPAIIALLLAIGSFVIAKHKGLKKKLAIAAIIVSGLAISIASYTTFVLNKTVVADEAFEKKIETSTEKVQEDLDSAIDEALGE